MKYLIEIVSERNEKIVNDRNFLLIQTGSAGHAFLILNVSLILSIL